MLFAVAFIDLRGVSELYLFCYFEPLPETDHVLVRMFFGDDSPTFDLDTAINEAYSPCLICLRIGLLVKMFFCLTVDQ